MDHVLSLVGEFYELTVVNFKADNLRDSHEILYLN